MEEEILLQREYHIPLELFRKAFITFQHKFVYPRNAALTVFLLGVAGVYVNAALQDPDNTIAYLLIFTCLAVITILWYNPQKIRRSLLQSIQQIEDDRYVLKVRESGLEIGTILPPPKPVEPEEDAQVQEPEEKPENGFQDIFEDPPEIEATVLPFDKGIRIIEKEAFFMVYKVKSMFYVVPKKDFSDVELQELTALFGKKLGTAFHPLKAV